VAFVESYLPAVNDALRLRIDTSRFPLLVKNPNGSLTVGPETAKCGAFAIGPVGSTWDEPQRNRQALLRERGSWQFRLVMQFDQPVSTEAFEASLAENPPVIPRDSTHDRRVALMLQSQDLSEPTNQLNPSVGTTATYTLEAELSPV